ncbi:GRIP and coiled-coil domain-containing protein 2-like isoform X3 [Mizuhopecten yessoensis]|uniref:GRIP and coiled-coil domain-containing protein 2-like isoform X3 n=1 Tax=Mizuhopecten yessoensis TaxID=6573 RepID=UPI000B45ECEE|nr:GRIP and coiled-coil domain-containing protein 2-like isoform X3 [Mizuhopecten yessoensis]
METELTTTRKNDELQLCYDLKKDSAGHLTELQRIVSKLTEIPKSQIKAKRDLRNVLCGACRGKPYEVLNLPLPSFSNIGCQTVDRFSELELSNSNEEFLNQMVHILIENERLGCTKSRNEGYDDQNRRTRQNTSVQPLPRKGLGVNKGSQEQGSSRTETERALSVQIAKLTSEKEELQSNLKTQQITMVKLQTTIDNNHEKQETAQIELKRAFSEKIGRLTSEKEELKNTLKTQQETIQNLQTTLEEQGSSRTETERALSVQIAKLTSEKEELQSNLKTQQITMVKLQTTIEMKAEETDLVENSRDVYHPQNRRVSFDSSPKTVYASSDRDIAQEQALGTDTCSIGQANQDKETSTMERNVESEQIEKSEMEFEKITQDMDNPDSELSSLQSQESTHSSEMKSFTLNSSKTEERQQTLQDENNVYESEIMTFKLENAEFRQSLKENSEKLTQAIDELERIKTENTSLKADCNTRDDDLRSMKTEKGKTDKHIESLKYEKQKLQCVVDDLNTKMKHTESELKKTRSDNKTLINSEEARDDEVESLKTEKDKLDSHMERVKQEKQNLQNKLDNLNAQMTQMESELKTTKAENEKLADSQTARDDELKSLKTEKSKLDSHMERVKQEKQNLQNKLDNVDAQMTQMESVLKKTKTENKKLIDSQNEQREESENLRHQIKELSLPKKKRVVLGLRSEKSGLGKTLVDMVTKELTRRLQQRLDMFSLNLTISFSQTPSEVTNGLQVVLCLNMSRVGTNIADTLKGIKADRDMFVMVLHHTSKENLSSLTPTSHRVTGSELRQLGGILDMVFDSSSGLYECDLNNTAVDKIASILRKCLIL